MSHKIHLLSLISGFPSSWTDLPVNAELEKQISVAVLADSEITGTKLGFYEPPKRVRKIKISYAAHDQIRTMWYGHRKSGAKSPPTIPLKYFVYGFGQKPPDTWVDIEVLPGLDNWRV